MPGPHRQRHLYPQHSLDGECRVNVKADKRIDRAVNQDMVVWLYADLCGLCQSDRVPYLGKKHDCVPYTGVAYSL